MGGSLVFPRPEGPGSFSSLPGLSSPRPERRRRPGDCRRQTGRLSPRERPVLCVDMRNSGWILLLSCFPIRGNRLFCALMPSFAGMRRQATAAFFPYEIFGAGAESPCFTRVRDFGFKNKIHMQRADSCPGVFLPVPSCRPRGAPFPFALPMPRFRQRERGEGAGAEVWAEGRKSPFAWVERAPRLFSLPGRGKGEGRAPEAYGEKVGGEGRPSRKGGLPGFFAFPYAPVVSTSLPFRLAARREGSVLSVFSLRHQVVRNG